MTDISMDLPRRDARIIGVVCGAHFTSHFFQLVLPPLFPLMQASLGLSFTELGLMVSLFFAASGLAQVGAGFAVDRFGPHVVLPAGVALLSGGVLLIGLAPYYSLMLVVAFVAGLGNSVYHPADFAVLTTRVSPGRRARAFSIHSVTGTLGWAAAPVTVGALATLFGWRSALVVAGVGGLIAAALIVMDRGDFTLPGPAHHKDDNQIKPSFVELLTNPAIVMAFLFFMLMTIALGTMQSYMPTLLPRVQSVSFGFATWVTTLYLIANALGALSGGFVADMTKRHDLIMAFNLAIAIMLFLLLGFVAMPDALILLVSAANGFLIGMTIPARDMLVQAATPPGSTGRVFGFVYSGLDLGALVVPLAVGILLDHGMNHGPFVLAAVALAITILSAALVGRRKAPVLEAQFGE